MKIPLAMALLLCLRFEAVTNAQVVHVVPPESWAWQSGSPRVVEERLENLAKAYKDRGQLARVALYDIAFPADAAEYRSLGGYAVMLVSAIAQAKDELPPKRVYVRMPESVVELQLISSSSSEIPPDSPIAKAFGTHRWEGLYYFPVNARRHGVELLMDFAKSRDGFVMQRFEPAGLEALAGLPDAVPSKDFPPKEAVLKLVTREFPGLVGAPTPAETPPVEEESRVPGY